MQYNTLNTRVKNKRDFLSNWLSTDPILLLGEIAIVDLSDGTDIRAKVGNGISSFTELPWLNERQIPDLSKYDTAISSLSVDLNGLSLSLSDYALSEDLCVAVSFLEDSLSRFVPISGDTLIQNNLSVGSNLYVAGSSLCSIIDNEISSQTSSQFEGLSDEVSLLEGSLSNYVPLSGNTLVSNILSIETDLYVRDTSISDLISGGSSRVILREWF